MWHAILALALFAPTGLILAAPVTDDVPVLPVDATCTSTDLVVGDATEPVVGKAADAYIEGVS